MNFTSAIKFFIKDSRSVGTLLVWFTVFSLVVSNGPFAHSYATFFGYNFLHIGSDVHLPVSLLHIINDMLMAVFFFSAGMEIKREIRVGELNTFKKAMMPVISATGGMLFPALIYLAFSQSGDYKGWGIPMATDIAFSLGVLSLLGRRAPLSMRVFLTAIAVIDDIGGILAIAIFYTGTLHLLYLFLAALVTAVLLLLNYLKITRISVYIILGIVLWYFVYRSGVHATIAGVILALCIPLTLIERLEHALHIPVNFFILPLFALANTAITLPAGIFSAIASPVHTAVFAGLVLGKPLGIFLFTYAAFKLKIASIPDHLSLKHILGVGIIAGVGFTVSIFIAMLAFTDEHTQLISKIAVINASVFSGIVGYLYLRFTTRKKRGPSTAKKNGLTEAKPFS